MRENIIEQLHRIEQQEGVTILYAAESGSRAWGFASPDSDYDVRFIYVRPRAFYLRLDHTKDVLDYPLSGELDISGWDLNKTLRLLHSSNPALFEWSQSPIVYHTTQQFQAFQPTLHSYFSAKSSLFHYLHMAENNSRGLEGERVRVKQYFYVLRPILACRWVLEHGTPPPVPFADLVETQLAPALRPAVEDLLRRKMDTPEAGGMSPSPLLNAYIWENLNQLHNEALSLPEEKRRDWGPLNTFFQEVVQ